MFRSLRSRLLLVVGASVFLTVLSIFYLAQREMETVVTSTEEQHAKDLLEAVILSVETEHDSLLFHREATMRRRKAELRNIVSMAFSQIEDFYRMSRAGRISEQEARRQAIEAMRRLRYDNGIGYIWINNLDRPIPRMIMHPTLPELDGQRLDDPRFNTALGRNENLFAAAVDTCINNGEGYIDYLWPKPIEEGLSSDQPKISYVRMFHQWGWVLGTGVYIDDIEAEAELRLDAIIDELDEIFTKINLAETGYMFLFNGDREMLVHPNIFGDAFATMKNPVTGRLFFEELVEVSKIPDRSFDYIWDKPGHEGEFRFPKRVFVSYFEPLDWYIGASLYIDELSRPGQTLRQRILMLALIPLAAALLITVALSRALAKPLWQLTRSARNIKRQGLASAQVPISGTTETRELGRVLDQMVTALRQTEEELRAANWELEAFVGTVSHDLRTPLTPIIGYAQFLQDEYRDELDEQALECLRDIELMGHRMLEHMEDMLTLAKAGYLERPKEPVDADAVLQEVIATLADETRKAEAKVKVSPLPPVTIPDSLLSQVFANLVGNAVRYAGGTIEVGGERLDDRIRFHVQDHGPGIPVKERAEIFSVFYRGTTGKRVHGTGMGLAIVEKVAKTYGGRAWVEETKGGGSTFWVEFEETTAANSV